MHKIIFFISCFSFLLYGCSSAETDNLIGMWVEPIPGQSNFYQGIELEPAGKASSINMYTLKYDSWEKIGNKLILKGISIGNGIEIKTSDTLEILRLTPDSLILNRDGYHINFARKSYYD